MALTATKWLLIFLFIFAFQDLAVWSEVTKTREIDQGAKGDPSKTSIKLTSNSTTRTTKKHANITLTPSKPSNVTNNDSSSGDNGFHFPNNKGLLKRMLYVAVGCSILIALYFIVKTIRTKSRKSKSKKYGMIFSSGDVEMQPLDNDDDDDDMTVFDRKIRK